MNQVGYWYHIFSVSSVCSADYLCNNVDPSPVFRLSFHCVLQKNVTRQSMSVIDEMYNHTVRGAGRFKIKEPHVYRYTLHDWILTTCPMFLMSITAWRYVDIMDCCERWIVAFSLVGNNVTIWKCTWITMHFEHSNARA